MSGITIITEHLCREVELGQLVGFGTFCTFIFTGGLLLFKLIYKLETNKFMRRLIIWSSVFIIGVYIWFLISQINSYNTTHMEYTITIDDSVGFNDFHKKYEIISVNGDEYRVVER